MRYLLFVVIGLIGCFPLRAQTPEDNLRDEEYYPFQNGYEEPYSPMIDTDSSLFYRAIQSTGDLFRDATDFKFSFVAYNRRGEPYRPDRMSLNGIRLPSRYIPSMNALYPQKYGEPMNGWHLPTTLDAEYRTSEEPLLPERNAALQFSGRNYLMGLRLTIAENLGRNWDLAATVQGRTGRDLYADGVFSNSLNAAILLSKRFGDRHLFSLLTVVPVSMRSLRTSSTREAFDLTGNPLYNPSWGYQDGKVRSGRIRREAVPLAAAAYRIRLTDATSLAATFTAETGIRRYSSLAWYDAPSPMPDYYRWMPGYQTDPVTRLERCPLHPNRLGRILPAKQKQQGRQRDLSHGGPCGAHRQYAAPRGGHHPNQRTTDGTLRHPGGPDGLPILQTDEGFDGAQLFRRSRLLPDRRRRLWQQTPERSASSRSDHPRRRSLRLRLRLAAQ